MLLVAVRDALTKPGRFLRTALAIALGVALVTGTYVLTDTTSAAFAQAVDEQTSQYDLVVRSIAPFDSQTGSTSSREPLPEALADRVAAIDGVAAIDPRVLGYAQVLDRDGNAITPIGPPTLGTSWGGNQVADLVDGRPPTDTGEVALDEATAENAGVGVGDRVTILFVGPAQSFEVVGITSDRATLGATLASFDLPTAQVLLEKYDVLDSISVEVADGADASAVRAEIATVLDDDQEVVTTEQERDEVAKIWTEALGGIRTALLVFAGVALAVGAFQIFNTFSILLTQRTHELGLLRALGAGRGQVSRSVIGEAVVIGSISSVAGLGLGVLVAIGMLAMIRGAGIDLPSTDPVVLERTVVISCVAGLVTTVIAASLPARRAGSVAPVVAMAGAIEAKPGATRRRGAVGAILVATGAAAITRGLAGGVASPLQWVGPGAGAVFLGVAVLAPFLAAPVAHAIGRPLRRIGGEPAALAEENAARDRRRTAATAAALMIGLGVVGFVAILADSIKVSTVHSIDTNAKADLSIMANGMMGAVGFSPGLADQLDELPEVASTSQLRVGQMGLDGTAKQLIAIDPATIGDVLRLDAHSQATFASLGPTSIAVNERTLEAKGWTVGEVLDLEFSRTGTVPMTIAGTFSGGALDDSDYLLSLDAYEANFTDPLDMAVYLTYADDVEGVDARAAVDAVLADYPNVSSYDAEEAKDRIAGEVDKFLAMITALLAMSLLISYVGIANTLALSVVERTRELGLLRAVGMTRRQLKRMVRFEATIVAVLGTGLGAVVALGLAWSMVRALADDGVTVFHLPWAQLLGLAALAVVAAGVAAGRPARRAARLPVLDAITGG